MLRTLVMQLVADRAHHLSGASGSMLECLTRDESICLYAGGTLEARSNSRGELARSLVLACASASGALSINDAQTDPRIDRALCRELGVHALLAVSRRWRPDELGVLSVVNGQNPFSDKDVHTLEVLMDLLSATVMDVLDQPARVTLTALGDSGYQQVLDAIADMVLVKGPRSRIVWGNRAFREVYGMTNEQLRGIIDSSFSEPDHTQKYVQDDTLVFETGKTLDIPDEPLRLQDGEIHSYHTVKSAIFDASGKVAMTVAVLRDITERKRVEEELTLHREQLERLVHERTAELEVAKATAENANRAKSAFLTNMSHELRTPMHAVLAYTRLCLTRTADAKLQDFLKRIVDSGERLLGLLNELLDLSKLQAGKMSSDYAACNVESIVRDVALEMEPLLTSKQLSLTYEHAPGCDSCLAPVDRKHLAQAFYNILANAVRFSSDGGKLGVRFAYAELAPDPLLAGGVPRPALEVAISDEGIGIPEAELESIFDEFVQSTKTHTNAGGTGLGLAICREIAKLHRGSVRARNNAVHGATFLLTVPLHLPAELQLEVAS